MAEHQPTYDLMLLLSSAIEDSERASILSDVESAISAGAGEIQRRDDWGVRPLTFKINHQREADYHLLQFTGPTALLETLNHNLHIADGVLRFRIIKVTPGTPAAPDSPPPVIGAMPPQGPDGRTAAPVAAVASASAEDSDED
jgi:small subunit ribosomal protein S6